MLFQFSHGGSAAVELSVKHPSVNLQAAILAHSGMFTRTMDQEETRLKCNNWNLCNFT